MGSLWLKFSELNKNRAPHFNRSVSFPLALRPSLFSFPSLSLFLRSPTGCTFPFWHPPTWHPPTQTGVQKCGSNFLGAFGAGARAVQVNRELVAFRRTLRNTLGSSHRSYQQLRSSRVFDTEVTDDAVIVEDAVSEELTPVPAPSTPVAEPAVVSTEA